MKKRSRRGRSMNPRITSKRMDIVYLLLLAVINLRVVMWFESPRVLASGDFRPPLNSAAFIKRALHLWDEIDFGLPSVYTPRILSAFELQYLLYTKLGLSPTHAQLLATYIIYLAFSVACYILFKLIIKDRMGAFIAALFMITNPLLVNDREVSAIGFVAYYLLPAILPLLPLIKILEGNRRYIYIVLSGLALNLGYSSFPNYRPIVMSATFMLILAMYYMLERAVVIHRRGDSVSITIDTAYVKTITKNLVFVAIVFILTSIWMFYIILVSSDVLLASLKEVSIPKFAHKIRPLDVFRFIGKWGFYSGALGRPYIPYRDAYLRNHLFIIVTYAPTLLSLLSFASRRRLKISMYFGVIALVGFVLSMGYNALGNIYITLTEIPLLKVYREPTYWLFYSLFSVSTLLGVAVVNLAEWTRRHGNAIKGIILLVMILLLHAVSYPLLTGDVARNWLNPSLKGYDVSLGVYLEINERIPSTYWTILLPNRYTYVIFNSSGSPWGLGNPWPLLLSKPIITGVGSEYVESPSKGLIQRVYSELVDGRNASKLMGILGIRYLLVERHIIFGHKTDYRVYERVLRGNSSFSVIKDLGIVALYENEYSLPMIYAADKVIVVGSIDDMLLQIRNSDWNELKHVVFLNTTDVNLVSRLLKGLAAPANMEVRKESSTQYVVRTHARGPFILVLLQNYDTAWEVLVNGKKLPEEFHFKANGYANAWLINTKGDVKIIVRYGPQHTFKYAIAISLLAAIALITLPYVGTLKRRMGHYNRALKNILRTFFR